MDTPTRRRRPVAEINVVPYIDVMLVLLVIFMATAPLLAQGIRVDLPKAPAEPVPREDLEDPLIVTIRADGVLFVNLGEDQDGPGSGREITPEALEQTAGKVIAARADVPIFVRGDHTIAYGRVVDVMALLQRAGAPAVGLITEPPAATR